MSRLSSDFQVIEATGRKGVRDVVSSPLTVTGYVNVGGIGIVPYEGPLERDLLELYDFYGVAASIQSQPLRLEFREGAHYRYTPDYLIHFKPRVCGRIPSPILAEVKGKEKIIKCWDQLQPGFLRASALCRARNWRFRILTEKNIRHSELETIRFLRPYIAINDPEGLAYVLYEQVKTLGITTPSELLSSCFTSLDRRVEAIPAMWHLIANRQIKIDMRRRLTMETPMIWERHAHGR